MYIYVLIAVALSLFAITFPRMDQRSRSVSIISIIIFFLIFVGFRGSHVDLDYLFVYGHDLKKVPEIDTLFSDIKGYYHHLPAPELSFCLLATFAKAIFSSYALPAIIFIYALFTIPIKIKAIYNLSSRETFGFAVLVFYSNLFILQEMTQIRAGLSVALFMLALPSVIERNWKRYFSLVLLAALIHRSAFLTFPVYFLNTKFINFKWWLTAVFVLFGLALIRFDVVSILLDYNIPVLHDKLTNYIQMQAWQNFKVNLFNVFLFLQLLIACVLYWKRRLIEPHCPCFYLLLKIDFISLLFFYFFVGIPVFAFRLSDIFCCSTIILYPLVYYVIKPKFLAQFAVLGMAWCMLLINLFHNTQLLSAYTMLFFE